MSFWNPARLSEDKQMELDKRVILGIAEDKLKKDLEKVNKKIEIDNKKWEDLNIFATTRKQRANMNVRRDNLAYEKMQIVRRLELIEEELR